MNCRRHGSKPTIGLWMLVAVADLGILVAATSALTVLLVLAGLVVLAGGVLAARSMLRRTDATPAVARATQTVARRRV
ncbi:hypothetical protein ACQP2F_42530 [Actinoplanes sp. CA-030573]|uniref:hypothetical protein n=1 Tax=Actinoplanes sp. CA-030573 TaxID=3239898 RepID=UPI003D943FA7